ncbi:hypothetical protein Tco_0554611 [Tanacetum coccineum]
MEEDDQAIKTIFFGLLETSYFAVDVVKLLLRKSGYVVQQMMERFCYWNSERRISCFNELERVYIPDGESIESLLSPISQITIGSLCFKSIWIDSLPRASAVQNVRNQVVQNAVQNLGVQNVGNQNGLIIVLRIANSNANKIWNGNEVAAQAEGNANGNNGNQIRCYNFIGLSHYARNCTVRPRIRDAAYLQT